MMLQELINQPENIETNEDKLKFKVDTMILTGETRSKPLLVRGINANEDTTSSNNN